MKIASPNDFVPISRIEFTVLYNPPLVKGIEIYSRLIPLGDHEIDDVISGTLVSKVIPGRYIATLNSDVWMVTRPLQQVYLYH